MNGLLVSILVDSHYSVVVMSLPLQGISRFLS